MLLCNFTGTDYSDTSCAAAARSENALHSRNILLNEVIWHKRCDCFTVYDSAVFTKQTAAHLSSEWLLAGTSGAVDIPKKSLCIADLKALRRAPQSGELGVKACRPRKCSIAESLPEPGKFAEKLFLADLAKSLCTELRSDLAHIRRERGLLLSSAGGLTNTIA